MTALLLIAAITLRGDLDTLTEFIRLPDSYSPKYMEDIPGSDEFYDSLCYYADRTWSVYTNGVITTMTNVNIGPVVIRNLTQLNSPYYLYYDLNDVYTTLGWTPTLTGRYEQWKPAKFDMNRVGMTDGKRVNARIVSNGDGNKQSLFELLGENISQPRSYMLNDNTAAALLATYAAYYERLYYASQGEVNDWDEEVWGAAAACDEFPLNLTNDEYQASCYFDLTAASTNGYRTIPNVRKIIGRREIATLQTNVLEMLTSEPTFYKSDKIVHPALVYRPGWIADLSEMPNDTAYDESRIWWASQKNPPKIDIERTSGSTFSQEPSRYGFGFMPNFDWTSEPVAVRNGDDFVKTHDWATRCVTLTAAAANYPTHPIERLFHELGYDYVGEVNVSDFVKPYHFTDNGNDQNSIYEYMTNIWIKCVKQYADKDDAFDNYVNTAYSAVNEPTAMRRIRANDYVGVNHVLGAMNRTYHLPVVKLCCTNEFWKHSRKVTYESDTFHIALTKEGDYYKHPSKDGSPVISFWMHQVGGIENTSTNWIDHTVRDKIELHVSTISESSSPYMISPYSGGDIYLDGLVLSKISASVFEPGENHTIDILDVSANGDALYIRFREGENEYTGSYEGLPDVIDIDVKPQSILKRSYQYDECYDYGLRVSQVQPGADGLDMLKEGLTAYLADRDIVYTATNTEYKSDNFSYVDRGSLVGSYSTVIGDIRDEFNSAAVDLHEGHNYRSAESFVEMPDQTSVSAGCIDSFKIVDYTLTGITPQNTITVSNVTYNAYFDVTNTTVDSWLEVNNTENWNAVYRDIHNFGVLSNGTWITGTDEVIKISEWPIEPSSTTNNVDEQVEHEIVEVGPFHFETGNERFTITNSVITNVWIGINNFSVTNEGHEVYHYIHYFDENMIEISNKFEKVNEYLNVVESQGESESEEYSTYNAIPRIVGLEDASRVEEEIEEHAETGIFRVEYTYENPQSNILRCWWVYPSKTEFIGYAQTPKIGTYELNLRTASSNVVFNLWKPVKEMKIEGRFKILNKVDWKWKQLNIESN